LSTIGGVEVILILDDCFCTNLVFLLIQGTLPVQTLFFFCKIVWLFVFSEDCFHLMAYKIFYLMKKNLVEMLKCRQTTTREKLEKYMAKESKLKKL